MENIFQEIQNRIKILSHLLMASAFNVAEGAKHWH